MKTSATEIITRTIAALLALTTFLTAPGCKTAATPTPQSAQANATTLPDAPAPGQPLFHTDQQATDAMLAAVKAQDHDQIHLLLGPSWKDLISGDKAEDAGDFKAFTQRAAESARLDRQDETTTILYVGNDDWPFPIPIVKTPDGKWFFDTNAGKTEILARRIGGNELNAIQVCHEYVQAQHDYASQPRDDTNIKKFAQRIISTPGKTDGLYWPATPDQPQSPFAHFFAIASTQGYDPATGHSHEPYEGYRFRILKRQGSSAEGGQLDYIVNGNMTAGFALVAFPINYEKSGIMTFIVNQDGNIYQKDQGPDSTKLARQLTEYNPDTTWTLVKD